MNTKGRLANMKENEKVIMEKGIHTDFKENMTYGEYLQLDSLLSSQQRLSIIMMKCYLSLSTKRVSFG